MSNGKFSWSKWSVICVFFAFLSTFSGTAIGQESPAVHVGSAQITGLPDDWTHRHVVFSNPGTEQEAISAGRHQQWNKVVNNQRYVIQQLKKNLPVQGPAAVDAAYRAKWTSEAYGGRGSGFGRSEDYGHDSRYEGGTPRPTDPRQKPVVSKSSIHRDWSMPLGGSGLAAGQYPAKYSFSNTVANCSDYVIYPTGAAGSSTQATIVAFNNIYVGSSGGCQTTLPTVYWAFNTPPGGVQANSATANLSPVLSYDGKQVAFVETYSSTGYLVLLKMASESSSAYNLPSAALSYQSLANYKTCIAPCYTTISLGAADTNSAPYYDYSGSDTLYVGDNSGKLHEVTGVFSGTPQMDPNANWPVIASTQTSPILTSPVLDSEASGLIFVADATGYLHSVPSTGGTTNVKTSNQMECGTAGIVDAPYVDSTTEYVYAFMGYGCDTNKNTYINRFPAGTSISGSYGTSLSFANGGTSNPTASVLRAGDFDNQYFTGTGATGHLYVCENGRLYQIAMSNFSTISTFSTPVSAMGTAAACSPVTEFLGVKASTTLTASVAASGAINPTVASTTGIVSGDYVQIDSEIMLVSSVTNGTTFTVASAGRGRNGTTASTHTASATVQDIQDWLFMSGAGNGLATYCTVAGPCVFNYNVISGATTGNPTAGLSQAGATSGIVIDNLSTTQTGAQQIYFSTLSGNTAVQASQAALK